MRLIGVSGVSRQLRPVHRLTFAQTPERPDETTNLGVGLERDADLPRERDAEVLAAHTDVQLGDLDSTVCPVNRIYGSLYEAGRLGLR